MTIPNTPDVHDETPEYHLPEEHWPLPELSTVTPHSHPKASAYAEVQRSDDFRRLRRSFRNFAFPTVVAVVLWYLFYVLASTFAEDFMGAPLLGNLTVGMIIGLAQFPTTWFATWLYVRKAGKDLDPLAAELRTELEGEVQP